MKKLIQNKFPSKLSKAKSALIIVLALSLSIGVFSSYVTHKSIKKGSIAAAPMTLKVQKITDTLEALTDMAFPGNGDVWVTEQAGKIWVIRNGKLNDAPLLDLRSIMLKINNGYEERGLLGITLHPQFSSNKKFYVFYSRRSTQKFDHTDVVAEYKLSDADHVDPNSGRIILAVEKPDGNHDGGCLKFGPDGYLYISLGDGGGQHDKHGTIGNGQNMNTLLGKILRVDINTDSGYVVPKDNPFVGKPDVKPEIWAYGFRNPYRFSFDKVTKQLFAGEVGQDLWEEVDIVKKGANYGWRIVEGTHCHNFTNTPETGCNIKGITMPISEYDHKEGVSVMGGYVYNGNQLPSLKSKYVFADWTGPIFYLQKSNNTWLRGKITLQNIPANLKITGINEDGAGELYVLTNPDTGPGNKKCGIYKIVKS